MLIEQLVQVKRAALDLLVRMTEATDPDERGAMIRSLEPLSGDYERVFTSDVAAAVRSAYRPLWRSPPGWPVQAEHKLLWISVAGAPDLAHGTVYARDFPCGYRDLAGLLEEDQVWVAWGYLERGEAVGLSFDGLVPIDGRWAWFPKPWLYVPAMRAMTMASHWVE